MYACYYIYSGLGSVLKDEALTVPTFLSPGPSQIFSWHNGNVTHIQWVKDNKKGERKKRKKWKHVRMRMLDEHPSLTTSKKSLPLILQLNFFCESSRNSLPNYYIPGLQASIITPQCCQEYILFTVILLCEMSLQSFHRDNSTSAQPPGSQLAIYRTLPHFFFPEFLAIFSFLFY